MESCCRNDSQQSSLLTKEEIRKQIMEVTDASILASVDQVQQLDTEVSMEKLQNSEAEFNSAENMECARWSSLDSVYSAFDDELSSYNLPASDAALNVTFNVEVSCLGSYLSTNDLLDPKCAMKIVYDLDESAGIDNNCINNCKGNQTFLLETPEDDHGSKPGVQHLTSSASKTWSPVVREPPSLYTGNFSDDETKCDNRQISGKNDVKLKGTIVCQKSELLSDFQMANGEQNTSSSVFELENKVRKSSRAMYITSTPLSSPVEGCANAGGGVDSNGAAKLVQRASSRTTCECTHYISNACRSLQIDEVTNTSSEHLVQNFDDQKFHKSGDRIAMSSLEQDDKMFKDVVCKHDETYTVSDLAATAAGDCGTNPLYHKRLASVSHSDDKAHWRGSVDNCDNRCFMLQQSTDDEDSDPDNDLSVSNIDVFKDDGDIASFFVTEWPSVLTNDYHALLLSTSYRDNILLPQDASSPQNIRIVVRSASSPSDLFTDWSFSSLLGQVYPSFDASSVNELDEYVSHHPSSMHCFSDVTRFSELDEKQQMDNVGR